MKWINIVLLSIMLFTGTALAKYPIVDTGQNRCYDTEKEIVFPKAGERFFGQDAQYKGNQPSYRDNGDGTITDLVTGLMWQKSPDFKNKTTFGDAMKGAKKLRLAGFDDWRMPTIKELYSLIDFRGYSNVTIRTSKPYFGHEVL